MRMMAARLSGAIGYSSRLLSVRVFRHNAMVLPVLWQMIAGGVLAIILDMLIHAQRPSGFPRRTDTIARLSATVRPSIHPHLLIGSRTDGQVRRSD